MVNPQCFLGKVILPLNPENCSIHGAGQDEEREEGSRKRKPPQWSSAGKPGLS